MLACDTSQQYSTDWVDSGKMLVGDGILSAECILLRLTGKQGSVAEGHWVYCGIQKECIKCILPSELTDNAG
jgi:hypothetical protein